jgi:hypothetical protein
MKAVCEGVDAARFEAIGGSIFKRLLARFDIGGWHSADILRLCYGGRPKDDQHRE